MEITKDRAAKKMLSYMKRQITIKELVDWAEHAVMEGKFKPGQEKVLREVTGRIGVADVKAFGLAWEDCDALMKKLGYKIHIDAIAA